MKRLLKKGISLIISFSLLFGTFSFAAGGEEYQNHWAKENIEKARELGIIDFTPGGEFLPDKNLTRAEAVKIMNRTFGFTAGKATPFTDIKGHWAETEIEIAYAAGYIKGTSESSFSPEGELTRQQQAVMLYRAFAFAPEKMEKPFKDWDTISDWAKEAVATLAVKNIFKGLPGGEFAPQARMTKAQAATVAVSSHLLYQEEQVKKQNEQANLDQKMKDQKPSVLAESKEEQGQYIPLPDESLTNPMRFRQAGDDFYVLHVNENEELTKVRQDILRNYPMIQDEKLYLAKAYKDEKQVLAYIEQSDIRFPALSDKPLIIEGLYIADEHRNLSLLSADQELSGRPELMLAVGRVKGTKPLVVGRKIIGYMENSLNVGLDLQPETILVKGLTFDLEQTDKDGLVQQAAISQSGMVTEMPEDLEIINNRIYLGQNSVAVKSGIRIKIPVKTGKLLIQGNEIKGHGFTGEKSRNAEAISLITRARPDTEVIIRDNYIKDYMFHGIGISAGQDTIVKIENNHLQNIGQNGIGIFVFDHVKELAISGNKIDSFGTKEILSGPFGTEPKVSAESETGISLEYIDMVYGVKVNQKYYSQKERLTHDLMLVDNQVAAKERNDALDGVHDCTPVYIGQKGRFGDPVAALNGRGRLNKKEVIVVKEENGDLELGVNPNDPTAHKQVKSLRIVGNGSGRILLSENLEILEDLIIDLPNASLQNKAKVQGKIQIINIRENDASAFQLEIANNKIFRGSSQPLSVVVTGIKNKEDQPVAKETSKLAGNLVLKAGKEIVSSDKYQILDTEDTIILSKNYLDTLSKSITFTLEYQDPENQVEMVSKNFDIIVEDLSAGKLGFVADKDKSIICAFAPEEGIQIKVTGLKNTKGEAITPAQSNLSAHAKLMISYQKAGADELLWDEEGDILTIKKALLDRVPSPAWGNTQPIKLSLHDPANNIGEIELRLELLVLNHSVNKGEILGLTPLTFTEGAATDEGLRFQIKDLRNARGEILSPDKTNLADYLGVEPFPVDWKLEMTGMGDQIRFNPDHYQINDDEDIITLKKEYLDLIKSNARDTEFGIKQYIFKYRDPRYGTEFRSQKILVHIKKQIIPLNKETKITSDTLQIMENRIRSGQQTLSGSATVEWLLTQIKRGNPRQTLRIYPAAQIVDGILPPANIYQYKDEYENIASGDMLVVTAEDGEHRAYYQLDFAEEAEESLIQGIADADIALQLGKTFVKIQGSHTVSEVLSAFTYQADVQKMILEGEKVLPAVQKVDENMILQVQKDGKTEKRQIQVVKEPVYRALIVANSDYPGDKSDLAGPVGDAKLMQQVFAAQRFAGKKMSQIVVKENQEKADFLQAIKDAYAGANENDISYFYYSGHGFNHKEISYLCMVGAALGEADPIDLWVSVDELKTALDAVPGKKILILDSCNSGGFIGKKAYDANSGATPKQGKQSLAFVETVVSQFAAQSVSQPNYLISDKYKVLAASSENEFSYEDKLEKLGKFTKALAQAAGVDGNLRADENNDGKAGLEELFAYLDKHVIYTSHIQAYPRKDQFTIFENPVAPRPLSDDVVISARDNAYKVIIKGKQRMITSDRITIDTNMTVTDFLSHVQKGEEHQELFVLPELVELDNTNAKADEEKMAGLDRLMVIAENGDKVAYQIVVKKAGSNSGTASQAAIAIPDFDGIYQISANKEITSGSGELTTALTVGDFLAKLKNKAQYDEIKIGNKNSPFANKDDAQPLAEGDVLHLQKGSKKASYSLRLKTISAEFPLPDFGGKYKLSFDQKKILGDSEDLTTDVTVESFLNNFTNLSDYDQAKVLKAYENEIVKSNEMKLENEDKLFLKKGNMEKTFLLMVEEAGNGPIIIIP
ncbi:hypothetical protein EII17_12445 [Clostridiales bacterium COT073_COT-073]|nr:hypothetical protein EII17_12445 [Clostridiales bacterium COT073_COT-073]